MYKIINLYWTLSGKLLYCVCLIVQLVTTTPTTTQPTQANDPATIIKWEGSVKIKGACVVAVCQLEFLNELCLNLANNIKVAINATQLLTTLDVHKMNKHHVQRLSYLCLKLEHSFEINMKYIDNNILCNNNTMSKMYVDYNTLRGKLDIIWGLVKSWKPPTTRTSFPKIEWAHQVPSLITELESTRPSPQRKSQHFIVATLVGLGVAFGAGALTTSLVGSFAGNNNQQDIKILNENIKKINTKLTITNERITILSENVTKSISDIKLILDKMVRVQETGDLYSLMLWNLDQLIQVSTQTYQSFKLGKVIVTMLEAGIINSDLIEISSFKRIIQEGLMTFKELEFPLNINRLTLPQITKIIKVQKIGINQFIINIPLVNKRSYQVNTLIPHPVNIDSKTLVIAELDKLLLTSDSNYILTDPSNIHSLDGKNQILLKQEPMFALHRNSCEWATYNLNITAMLNLCNYHKLGIDKGIYVKDTSYYRLVYFTELTQIELNCPDRNIRDKLEGLHKLPLQCDLSSDLLYWPAKQTLTINLEELLTAVPTEFDATKLPIIDFNDTTNVHDSIKTLISNLPGKNSSFTFEFQDNLTLEEVQSYTIVAYGALCVMVIINSIIIGLIVLFKIRKWMNGRNSSIHLPSNLSQDRFNGLRDSLRQGKNKLRDSISRRLPHSPSLRLNSMRSSLRDKFRAHKAEVPKSVEIGVNTDFSTMEMVNHNKINNKNYNVDKHIYPPIPRYT